MGLVPRRSQSPPFSRSIPTVLRPDQKQKETAPVLCLLKIKELLAQFLDRGGCASDKYREASLAAQTGCVIRMNGLLSRKENGAVGVGNTDLILPVRVRTCAEGVGRTGGRLLWFPGMQPVRSSNGRNEEASPRYFAGWRVGRSGRASFRPVGEAWDRAPARSPEKNNTVTLSGHFGAWRCHVKTTVIHSDRMKSHAVSART
jgi:hypothetical protein